MAAGASSAQYDKYEPLSSTVAVRHIKINNNATWSDAFQFAEPADQTWNLVGQKFELDVQRNRYDLVPLLSLSTDNGRIITSDPIQRAIYFKVSPADIQANLPPGVYIYDLVMVAADDFRTTLMTGTVTVGQGVTYPTVG